MIIWGITANNHDASIAVFEHKILGLTDTKKLKLLWAGMTKDFSNIPNDPHLNDAMVDYLMKEFGAPKKIYFYERPFLKSIRQLLAGQGFKFKQNNIKKYLARYNIYAPIKYIRHHKAHAAYGYYTSKFRNAAIIVLDSIGEIETFSIWQGHRDKIMCTYSQGYPNSVGLFYSAMTQRCGFIPNKDESQLEQLARSGDWKIHYDTFFDDLIKKIMPFKLKINLHRGCRAWLPELTQEKDLADLAATTQKIFEEIILEACSWCRMYLKSRNLILVGGCALNKTAVNKISPLWNNFYVPKHPGDPGACIGAVLAAHENHIDFDPNVWYNKN